MTTSINVQLLRFSAGVLVWMAASISTIAADPLEEFFENRIRPVLAAHCVQCHGDQRSEGGLRLDSREALMQGGESGQILNTDQVDKSLILRAISRVDDVSAMPPEKDKALRPEQISDFRRWISEGAAWPTTSARFVTEKHWAFAPFAKKAIHSNHRVLLGSQRHRRFHSNGSRFRWGQACSHGGQADADSTCHL